MMDNRKKSVVNITEKDVELAQKLAKKIKKEEKISLSVGENGVFAIFQQPYGRGKKISLYTVHLNVSSIPVISVKANAIDLYLPSCKIRIITKHK